MEFDTFFTRHFVTNQGIAIYRYREGNFSRVFSAIFWTKAGCPYCPSRLMLEAAESIKDEANVRFPRPNISKNTLVLSFRGGDMFSKGNVRGRNNYGQPCCQFYLDAMERDRGHDQVLLVGEDRKNPCVQLCLDRGGIWHEHRSWKEDYAILLWAERLVMSRSSFMRPIMYFSPVMKIWYNFGGLDVMDCGCGPVWHVFQPFGAHWHCIPSRSYQEDVLVNWELHKMKRIMNDKCAWKWIPYVSTSDYQKIPVVYNRHRCKRV
jgi:hypothetical protein